MKKISLLVFLIFSLAACATNPDGSKLSADDEESGVEYYNRAMFNFNYQFNKKVMKPVAEGYKSVTNQFFRDRVSAFFNNLEEPAYFVNNLFQGEIKNSGVSVGRFLINTTLGLAGTFDVAAGWGLEKKKNSFDQTMAKYCVPDGPFFVLPIIGPATPRYVIGWSADAYASPLFWALIDVEDDGVDAAVIGATGLKYINIYAENMGLLESLEEGSVDFYATMKSAFLQNRQKFTSLCAENNADEDALSYDFDFGYDDAFDEEME